MYKPEWLPCISICENFFYQRLEEGVSPGLFHPNTVKQEKDPRDCQTHCWELILLFLCINVFFYVLPMQERWDTFVYKCVLFEKFIYL